MGTDLREVLNAIRYMGRSGGGCRRLPKDFPPCRRSTGGSAASCAVSCFRWARRRPPAASQSQDCRRPDQGAPVELSRVTSSKCMLTSRGVFEPEHFLTVAIALLPTYGRASRRSVRHRISRRLRMPDDVLSDDDISGSRKGPSILRAAASQHIAKR
ncbi:hypothetical protein GNX16_08995 [Mesorhizobium japonicum]|nr:hypothetical protein [Mesorhizobium japonicum]